MPSVNANPASAQLSRAYLLAYRRLCENSELDLLTELDDLSEEIAAREQRVTVVLRLLEDTRRALCTTVAALEPATRRTLRLCGDERPDDTA